MFGLDSWQFWALLSAFFAALTAILAKAGLPGVHPDMATLFRTAVLLPLLAGWVLVTGRWVNPTSLPGRALFFLAASALATGASWVCYFRALQLGDASRVAPVDKLSVVLVALLAFFFLHERPSMRDWVGISLVGAGVLLLVWRK